jgi:uncharacterized protein YaiL (DUF2058 family)
MIDSLRDQLLNLGFKAAPQPERKPAGGKGPAGGRPQGGKDGKPRGQGPARDAQRRAPGGQGQERKPQGKRRPDAEMDLGKAWALRANQEKNERIQAERQKQEEARLRREARARLEGLLKDNVLNDPAAEIARHFEYGGKIKRIYVNAEQLKALNAGQLGVLQQNGRYLLVSAQVLAQAETIFSPSVALKVDPDAPAGEDPYADPRYQVPDDLVW